jgi:hypothetical protein
LNLLTTINLALRAYILWVESSVARELDNLEDEIDTLATTGTPADKLRIEALSQRLSHKRERITRSRDDSPN